MDVGYSETEARAEGLILLKQLRLCRSVQDDGRCGLGIVNFRIVELRAHGIPAHQIRVVGPENVTNHVEVIDVRIEPHVVLVGGAQSQAYGRA